MQLIKHKVEYKSAATLNTFILLIMEYYITNRITLIYGMKQLPPN